MSKSTLLKFLLGFAFLLPAVALAQPSITTQPTPQIGGLGLSASFTVAASGSSLTYKWQKNGVDMSDAALHVAGSASATLTLTNLIASDFDTYRVVVSGTGGSVTSDGVALAELSPVVSGNTTSGFTLNWNSVAGATGYTVDIGTNRSFSNNVLVSAFDTSGATTYTATGLTENSTYFFRIKATGYGGNSLYIARTSSTADDLAGVVLDESLPAASGTSVQVANVNAALSADSNSYFQPTSTQAAWYPGGTSNINYLKNALFSVSSGTSRGYLAYLTSNGTTIDLADGEVLTARLRFKFNDGTPANLGGDFRVALLNSNGNGTNVNVTGGTNSTNPARLTTSTTLSVTNNVQARGYSGYIVETCASTSAPAANSISFWKRSQATWPNDSTTPDAGKTAGSGQWAGPSIGSGSGTLSSVAGSTFAIINSAGGTADAMPADGTEFVLDLSVKRDSATQATLTYTVTSGASTLQSYSTTQTSGAIESSFDTLFIYNNYNVVMSILGLTVAKTSAPAAPTAAAATGSSSAGFTANWNSVANAASYRLDVATDSGFTSFVSGYNDLNVGTATSLALTGLTANTAYYYRVRAVNQAGTSTNSSTITATTGVVAPTASAATSVLSTSFSANWGAVGGATGYRLDVATDSGFTSFVSGYNDLDVGNVLTSAVTGLAANTTYYYRVRAYSSAGTSGSSSTITVVTAPPVSTTSAATSITTSGFTANWSASTGATGYRLDVATDSGFTTLVSGYNNLDAGNVLTLAVSGLTDNTTYYYRVRAYNASATSASSNTTSATTLVSTVTAPTASAATSPTSSGFTANWSAVGGATGYHLDVSTSSSFLTYVTGYQDKDVGAVTTSAVTGLSSNTVYYYRVRALVGSNSSISSNTITATTALVIGTPPASQTVAEGANPSFTVSVNGNASLTYQWKLNTGDITGQTSATLTLANVQLADSGGSYTVVVTNAAGSVTSAAAILTVTQAAPVIATHPQTQSALTGTRAVFAVRATGTGPFTYQWKKDGSDISGATDLSLVLTNLQSSDAASYTVVVTNGGGSVTSNAAVLTLDAPAATLPTQPVIPAGTFRVTNYGAIGDGTTDNTTAIQAAINAAQTAGGGTVELPPAAGAYLSGPLSVPSNINLQIDGGATLRALPMTSYPGTSGSRSHLITFASNASNVAVTGTGTIEGDGSAWWTAYDGNSAIARPRLIQFTKSTNVLISGLTLQNSPQFHIALSGSGGTPNTNVTVYGVTITAPSSSPNTDGIDPTAQNCLIQKCSIATGDDNIAIKAQNGVCGNMTIAHCTFGTGHGLSIGGQTNYGVDGLTVTDCTFTGTTSGLRLKADPTQGGLVQNLSYSDITMTGVTYPIVFYSYYNVSGYGNPVNPATTTIAGNFNTTPPNALNSSTLPVWKNITISNLTSTGGGGSIIWGLPLASGLIANVTLDNVSLSGLKVYDATNVQLTGTSVVGALTTYNALVLTGQPSAQTIASGDSASFSVTAAGTSGANGTAATYQWKKDGTILTDGTQANGTVIAGATTATLTLSNTQPGYSGSYACTVSNDLDGYNTSGSTLAAGSLAVSATSSSALLTVTGVGTAPTIGTQPVNVTTFVGGEATFTVQATSDSAMTYQWYSGNPSTSFAPIADNNFFFGSNGPQLLIRNVQESSSGTYFVIITNSAGPTTSAVVRLTPVTRPIIDQQPLAQALYIGAKLTLTVAVSGTGPYTYEWKKEDVPLANDSRIAGVTTNTLTITNVQVSDTGNYSVRIYNPYGSVLSEVVAVSVTPVPTAPPAPVINAATSIDSNSFVISWNPATSATSYRLDVATNSGFSTYVAGYKDLDVGLNLSHAIANLRAAATFYVRVRALNSVGPSPYSSTITVTTLDTKVAPKFTSPASTTFTLGLASSFTVTATGKPTPTLAASGLPSWVSFTPASGLLAGTPPAGTANGQFVFNLTATNGVPPDATQLFTLSVQSPPSVSTPLLISTFAGQAGASGSTNDTGTAARFNNPSDVTADSLGNIYVADTDNHTIRKITSAGVVSTLAGSPGVKGDTTGSGANARFYAPTGVAVDPTGNVVYVADTLNHVIRKVTATGTMTPVAGAVGVSGSADGTGGTTGTARFYAPQGLAVSPDGKTLYVADTNNHTIRAIDLATTTVSTLAGLAGQSGTADGTGNGARFNAPSDVAVDQNGNLYVADTDNNCIRAITPSGVVTTLAGLPGSAGAADGTGSGARFNHPGSLVVDSDYSIYVVDTDNHSIRKIISAAGVVTTVAGQAGSIGSADGSGATARFNYPAGIALNSSGTFYIADTANHTIRASANLAAPVITQQPQGTTVTAGATVQLFVTATGQPAPTYQWRLNGSNLSGATSATLTLSAAQVSQSGKYSVVVTNSQGSVTSNEATVTINAPAGSDSGSTGGSSGGSGGGGGGGAPGFWFYLALVLLVAVRAFARRRAQSSSLSAS